MDIGDILLQKAAFHDSEVSIVPNYHRVVRVATHWYTDVRDCAELWNKPVFL